MSHHLMKATVKNFVLICLPSFRYRAQWTSMVRRKSPRTSILERPQFQRQPGEVGHGEAHLFKIRYVLEMKAAREFESLPHLGHVYRIETCLRYAGRPPPSIISPHSSHFLAPPPLLFYLLVFMWSDGAAVAVSLGGHRSCVGYACGAAFYDASSFNGNLELWDLSKTTTLYSGWLNRDQKVRKTFPRSKL